MCTDSCSARECIVSAATATMNYGRMKPSLPRPRTGSVPLSEVTVGYRDPPERDRCAQQQWRTTAMGLNQRID